MGTATVYRLDGTTELLDHRPTLEESRKIIDGWIELIKVGRTTTLVVDEEGRIKDKPVNREITAMYGHCTYGGYIVGDVIVLEGWGTVGD